MAKFSESFFESLRGAGRRGSPTDPMLQRQAGPQYGSTDPLARSLGGMLGMDMRTAPELATAELSKVDQTDPNSLIQALGVQAKYEQDPQKKVLYMLEIDKIKQKRAEDVKFKEQQSSFVEFIKTKYPQENTLADLAIKGVLTPKNLKDFVKNIDPSKQTKSADTVGNYIDEKGNEWILTSIRTTSGQVEGESDVNLVWSAIDPTEDKKPFGSTTPIGGQYGLTGPEAAKLKGVETLERDWGARVALAPDLAVEARETVLRTRTMLDLLNKINTGGLVPEVVAAAQGLFGVKPADVGEFQQLAQMELLRMLNETIKGNPTGREMDEVNKVIASLQKGEEVNERLLLRVLNEAERVEARNQFLVNKNPSRNEYLGFVDAQMDAAERQRQSEASGGSEADFYLDQAIIRNSKRGLQ
jgi:hypothetical protein